MEFRVGKYVEKYFRWTNTGQKTKKSPFCILKIAIFVIRLGFEPKTHSLEGCCSIQLSYRTEPFLLPASAAMAKSDCKDSYFYFTGKKSCSRPASGRNSGMPIFLRRRRGFS